MRKPVAPEAGRATNDHQGLTEAALSLLASTVFPYQAGYPFSSLGFAGVPCEINEHRLRFPR